MKSKQLLRQLWSLCLDNYLNYQAKVVFFEQSFRLFRFNIYFCHCKHLIN